MYRIIGIDGRQYGPVTAEQVREWIAGGRVNGQTSVQPEGGTEWKPLAGFPEFADALAAKAASAAPSPGVPPTLAAPPPATNADALAADIVARDYRLDIGSCLSRGWDLVMRHFWLLVGASFVLGLIEGAVPILTGVCMGGLYLLILKLIRGERAEFGDSFAGFSVAFLPLFLAGLISSLLATIGFLFCIVPGVYLMVAWIFAIPLVIDKKLDFWPAMEASRQVVNQHWWVIFGLLLVNLLVIVAGLAVCCVGVYVAQPIAYAALAYAYEDVYATKRPPAA